MSDPVRQAPNAAPPVDPRTGSASQGAGSRPRTEDPLEELARILGEGSAFPVRPESVVEVGRRATPTAARQVPQQLSALEAELFDELKSSVAPEARVIRGETERELPPMIPQRPADDRDIASLRIDPGPIEEARTAERTHPHETPYSDYYAYDEGVAAGSYDPALAPTPLEVGPSGQGRQPGRGPAYPRPTFDEFGRDEIARAAEETSPYAASNPAIVPHSRGEEQAAGRLLRDEPRSGLRIVAVVIGLVVAAGGAYAGWKAWGGSSGEPVLIRADGKPVKQMPGPGDQAAAGDTRPVLTPDSPNGASKLVSLQEDPVDQVAGRTPEGKEIRVINPGAPRPSSDQPHTVKTVVVRPDGSIVTDGDPARAAPPLASAVPPIVPPAEAVAPPAPPTPPTPALVPANVPLPQPAPPSPTAAKPSTPAAITTDGGEVHPAPVKTTVVKPVAIPVPTAPTATAPAPVKTVTTTPIQVPRPTQPVAANGGAPLALGPVAPRLASAQPPTAAPTPIVPAPIVRAQTPPTAPVATPAQPTAPVASAASAGAGSGDYMVQISASRSDAEARASFAAAQRRHTGLAGKSLDVQQANLGDKGTFYRARVAAGTREQAAALCGQIQSQGGQCMVVKR